MNNEQLILNAHNKDEYPPAHSAEHILNQTMVRNVHAIPISNAKKANWTIRFPPAPQRKTLRR